MRRVVFGFCFALSSICFGMEENGPVFTPPGDPLLQQRSLEVPIDEIQTEEIQTTLDHMFAVARGERTEIEKRVMVGLAAPQIGIMKRIILVDMGIDKDRKELGELVAFINPEILSYSTEQISLREGCYSVDRHVVGLVPRAESIQIRAYDRFGVFVEMELTGYTARIFQHEVDHLNGIRFPDRVGPSGALHWVEEHEFPEYRKNSETWPNLCPWELWISMKNNRVI